MCVCCAPRIFNRLTSCALCRHACQGNNVRNIRKCASAGQSEDVRLSTSLDTMHALYTTQGKEAAMSGHPFVMTPETPAAGVGNITTVADVVLTGCPAFSDGNSWIGQPDAPSQPRFPNWCYGLAYPVSALSYVGNFHSVTGHAVLAVAVDNARFSGNAIGGYEKTRACEFDLLCLQLQHVHS